MRKIRIFILMFLFIVPMTFAACGGDKVPPGKTQIIFWGAADLEEATVFKQIVDTYNATNTDDIWVKYEQKPMSDYDKLIDRTLAGQKGPDVFYANDKFYKKWVELNYLVNLESYISESELDLSRMWTNAVQRYRYNTVNNTSTPDAPLYALPKDISPTAIFYNKTQIEKQGVKIISVDKEDLAAFNAGEKADNCGKFKSDYGINYNVPAQGFYRSLYPFPGGSSAAWRAPAANERLVFNNRISMTWNESEDLGMLMTGSYNTKLGNSDTTWGYFTEWWFNYGWSVGGDCVEDTTGDGDFVFTLGSTDTRKLLYNADGKYAVGADGKAIFVKTQDIGTYQLEDGQYFGNELPSQFDAFSRFVNLSLPKSSGGLAIAMRPADISTSTSLNFFSTGKVAMLVEQNWRINAARRAIGNKFDWDVAPLPHHPDGIEIGHSGSTGFAIWSKSKKKDLSFKFIEYLVGDVAQTIQANGGFNMCNQRDIAMTEYVSYNTASGQSPQNIRVFVDYGDIQQPGDWWYMPDKDWIDVWAVPLNYDVRDGKLSLTQFFNQVTAETNAKLAAFKNV